MARRVLDPPAVSDLERCMHDGEIERHGADVVVRVTPRTPPPGTGVIPTRSAAEVMELILQATALIFANGETTERTVAAAREIGDAALAVVYGAGRLATLGLAAFSGGMGALIRRGLAKVSSNLFVQPFCAAFLAGLIGGISRRFQLGPELALVALCPCMLLVPGPHFLNGIIDLVRGRVAIGGSRIAFSLLVVAAISTGLLLGLSSVGAAPPISLPSRTIALPLDV